MNERRVMINGRVHLYEEVGPLPPSGYSFLGALEYDIEEGKIRCHECEDGWFRGIGVFHLRAKHGLTAGGYKAKHGLNTQTALISPGTSELKRLAREKYIAAHPGCLEELQRYWPRNATGDQPRVRRRIEYRNERREGPERLRLGILALAEANGGRTPTRVQLSAAGIHIDRAAAFNGESGRAIIESLNLSPRKIGTDPRYSREELVEKLRSFHRSQQRLPKMADVERGGSLPNWKAFKREFGGLRQACEAAGLVASAAPVDKIGWRC